VAVEAPDVLAQWKLRGTRSSAGRRQEVVRPGARAEQSLALDLGTVLAPEAAAPRAVVLARRKAASLLSARSVREHVRPRGPCPRVGERMRGEPVVNQQAAPGNLRRRTAQSGRFAWGKRAPGVAAEALRGGSPVFLPSVVADRGVVQRRPNTARAPTELLQQHSPIWTFPRSLLGPLSRNCKLLTASPGPHRRQAALAGRRADQSLRTGLRSSPAPADRRLRFREQHAVTCSFPLSL
jgi:hypothetical protein